MSDATHARRARRIGRPRGPAAVPRAALARAPRTAREPADHRLRAPGVDDRAVPREPARRDRHAPAPTIDEKYFDQFIERIEFHGGDISVESLRVLQAVLDGPAIFYLALPPGVFADAAETIAKAGLADETNGWRRLVIEKPFGTDLDDRARAQRAAAQRTGAKTRSSASTTSSARRRCRTCSCSGSRTGSSSRCCNAGHVDEIQITVAETLGVEGRSRYYDGIGALRDMIQNHLIQMMTFATMEPPALWDAEMIRDHKVEVLKSVRTVDPDVDAVRGQYTAGLVEGEPRIGVPRRARCRSRRRAPTRSRRCGCIVDTWRWEGIPVLLRSGKRLAAKAHEVVFRFREPPTRLFRHTPLEHAEPNWLVFRMSPSECTELVVRTKQPGPRARSARVGAARRVRQRRRPRGVGVRVSCCSTCSKATTRRSCASTRSSGRGASSSRSSTRGRRARPRTTSPAATARPASTASSAPATRGGR